MDTFRNTKAIINLGAIRRNTQRLIAKYPGYEYYMAVVKADCYGYRGERVVRAMIEGGANCLALSGRLPTRTNSGPHRPGIRQNGHRRPLPQ